MNSCGRCLKEDCEYCQEIDRIIKEQQAKICCDDCYCLCVLERPNNKLKDVDILDDKFLIDCGSNKIEVNIIKALRKISRNIRDTDSGALLEIINQLKIDLVKERITYKTEKDKMMKRISNQEKEMKELKKKLADKFII